MASLELPFNIDATLTKLFHAVKSLNVLEAEENAATEKDVADEMLQSEGSHFAISSGLEQP